MKVIFPFLTVIEWNKEVFVFVSFAFLTAYARYITTFPFFYLQVFNCNFYWIADAHGWLKRNFDEIRILKVLQLTGGERNVTFPSDNFLF